MYRHLITALFLIAALACYAVGMPAGGSLFLVLGLLLEGAFWLRLFRRRPGP